MIDHETGGCKGLKVEVGFLLLAREMQRALKMVNFQAPNPLDGELGNGDTD